jgi:signal transduction histidine kinase
VADRGAGLAPGEEAKVFRKFYRGPRNRPGGLGLGLAIARQLVEAHSGQIVAHNREGDGAIFSIRLPIGEEMRLPDPEFAATDAVPDASHAKPAAAGVSPAK